MSNPPSGDDGTVDVESSTYKLEACSDPAVAMSLAPPALPVADVAPHDATPGSFAVTDGGTASYTIPLRVLPGRAGMEPQLAIVYDSGSGDGPMGPGFSLSGLSSISYCPRTIARDGRKLAVKYDLDDPLCLDGARLVEVNRTASAVEFRTVADSFQKVVGRFDPTSNDGRFISFEVHTLDGRVRGYGQDSPARTVVGAKAIAGTWFLSTVRDARSNTIAYTYTQDINPDGSTRAVRLDTIEYTANPSAGAAATRRVRIEHEPRFVHDRGFVGGSERVRDRWIRAIHLEHRSSNEWSAALRYELTYADHPSTGRSLLTEVRECAGSTCKRPVTFGWLRDQDDGFSTPPSTIASHASFTVGRLEFVADVTGDGLEDLVYSEAGGIDVAVNLGGGAFAAAARWFTNPGHLELNGMAQAVDHDADGFADLVVTGLVPENEHAIWIVLRSTGAAFVEDDHLGEADDVVDSRIADLEGDGQYEHLVAKLQQFCTGPYCNDFVVSWLWLIARPEHYGDVHVVDLDGDGATESVAPPSLFLDATGVGDPPWGTGSTYGAASHWEWEDTGIVWLGPFWEDADLVFADVNGDGLPDAVRQWYDGGPIELQFNTGRGFSATRWPALTPGFTAMWMGQAKPIDYNADGKVDLLVPGRDASCDSCWFVMQWSRDGRGDIEAINTGIAYENGDTLMVTDANGDGRQDIIVREVDEYQLYLNDGPHELIVTIDDGTAALDPGEAGYVPAVRIEYGNLVDRAVQLGLDPNDAAAENLTYAARWGTEVTCGATRRCVVGTARVVTAYQLDDGVGGKRSFAMKYRAARADAVWGGALGFHAVIRLDLDRQAGSVTLRDLRGYPQYALNPYAFAGQVSETWSWAPADQEQSPNRLRMSFQRGYFAVESTNGGNTYFVRPTAEQHWVREGSRGELTALQYVRGQATLGAISSKLLSAVARSIAAVDTFGNVLDETVRVYDTAYTDAYQREQRRTTRSYQLDTARWWSLLQQEDSCSTANGETACVRADPEYAPDGLLESSWNGDPDDTSTQLLISYERDAFGNVVLAQATPAEGASRSQCVTYDDQGMFPVMTRNAAGHEAYQRNDVWGNAVATRVPINALHALDTRRQYDRFGRPVKEVSPDATETSITTTRRRLSMEHGSARRDVWGYEVVTRATGTSPVTSWTDAKGRERLMWVDGPAIRAEHDGEVTMAPKFQMAIDYDPFGRVRRESQVNLSAMWTAAPSKVHYTAYTYDRLGRVVRVTTPWGATTSVSYQDNLETRVTAGESSDVTFNGAGRVTRVRDRLGTETTFTYGPFGVLRSTTNAGETTSHTYDALGRVRMDHDPNRGKTTMTYNGFGELTSTLDALGRKVTLEYDDLGRLTERLDSGAGGGTTTWTYDGDFTNPGACRGCVVASASPDGISRMYSYDRLGRPILSTLKLADRKLSMSFEYDSAGRLAKQTYPGGAGQPFVIRNQYDATGRLVAVLRDGETVPVWRLVSLDGRGRSREIELANEVRTTRVYDPRKDVIATLETRGPTALLQSITYSHDDRLNLRRKHDAEGAPEWYHHDALDRLWCVSSTDTVDGIAGCSLGLEYAPNGNIEWKSDVGTYTYDPQHPHAVATAGPFSFGYDAVGNQTLRTVGTSWTIGYTPFDLPRYYERPDLRLDFLYDAAQARVRQTKAGVRDVIYFDGLFELERDLTRVPVQEKHRYLVPVDGATVVVERVAGVAGETVTYLHPDALGSPHVTSTSTGARGAETRRYDAFGREVTPVSPDQLRLGYTGQEDDLEIELVNMRGRIYDPRFGRMLQVDPARGNLFDSQRANAYSYVSNQPLRLVDPSGFSAVNAQASGGSSNQGEYWTLTNPPLPAQAVPASIGSVGNSSAGALEALLGEDYGGRETAANAAALGDESQPASDRMERSGTLSDGSSWRAVEAEMAKGLASARASLDAVAENTSKSLQAGLDLAEFAILKHGETAQYAFLGVSAVAAASAVVLWAAGSAAVVGAASKVTTAASATGGAGVILKDEVTQVMARGAHLFQAQATYLVNSIGRWSVGIGGDSTLVSVMRAVRPDPRFQDLFMHGTAPGGTPVVRIMNRFTQGQALSKPIELAEMIRALDAIGYRGAQPLRVWGCWVGHQTRLLGQLAQHYGQRVIATKTAVFPTADGNHWSHWPETDRGVQWVMIDGRSWWQKLFGG